MLYYQCKTLVKTFLLLYPISRHVASFMKVGGGQPHPKSSAANKVGWGRVGQPPPTPDATCLYCLSR